MHKYWAIYGLFSWVYTKTAQNQNGPDQNGPQIFDMSKTAQDRYKTAQSYDQNGPQLN